MKNEKEREIWVFIKGFDRKYSISSYGKVRNNLTGRELSGKPNLGGYLQVRLYHGDNTSEWFLIHKLVAETFIPNLTDSEEIDHIDGIKTNNAVTNLRWVTSSENKMNICKEVRKRKKGKIKKILQYTLEGNLVREWKTAAEVERTTGYSSVCILWCCKGISKTAYGYKWEYNKETDSVKKNNAKKRYEKKRNELLKYQSEYEKKNRKRRTEYKRLYRQRKKALMESEKKEVGLC